MAPGLDLPGPALRLQQADHGERPETRGGLEYPAVVDILGKPDNCSEALFVRNGIRGDEQKNISVGFLNSQVILFTGSNIC